MRKEEKSQRTGVSTFASRTSPSTDQSLQKSFHLSHAGQNFKIFSPQNEKLKPRHATRQWTQTQQRQWFTDTVDKNASTQQAFGGNGG